MDTNKNVTRTTKPVLYTTAQPFLYTLNSKDIFIPFHCMHLKIINVKIKTVSIIKEYNTAIKY